MFKNKDNFKKIFIDKLEGTYDKGFKESTKKEQYHILGLLIMEYIEKDWTKTMNRYQFTKKKQIYYFSIEFLLGQLLGSNLLNLNIGRVVDEGLQDLGIKLAALEEQEADAGLGNGGLGRLAACFLDSLASLGLPGHGLGIRYKYGFFTQKIVDGYQTELPEEWLKKDNVWEVKRADQAIQVKFGGEVETSIVEGKLKFYHHKGELITAVPYDVPVIGYQNQTINTLRLWSTETEAISAFLYPDDNPVEGKILRLKQQYFLVSAGLQSILKNYLEQGNPISQFHKKVAIHVNDTHPVIAIPELMRILMDEQGLGWEEAWQTTTNTISYTNHTTLAEALEKWSVSIFKPLLPRIYMIIEEINQRFCRELWNSYPEDWERIAKMAIISYGKIHMAHLAIAGSHSVNGVSKIHSEILKNKEMKLFYEFFPTKFNNKTNGITFRRWLMKANPKLADLLTETIGASWIKNPLELNHLEEYAKNTSFQDKLTIIKKENKIKLAKRIKDHTGLIVNEASIFDVQVKRLHAYKRQLLNVVHIMYLYNRLKEDPNFKIVPRTFIFGSKAAPAYYYAKKIIKLINTLADKINKDKQTSDMLKVVFLENYRVSLAEDIFPATDVSEQISTASKEASGTGNMKFMLNGAVTIGTLDGANIEILEEVGKNNFFAFGLTATEVLSYYKNGGYSAYYLYQSNQEIRQVLDQLVNGFFPVPDDEFKEIYDSLLGQNDEYFVLADFRPYVKTQEQLGEAFNDKRGWLEKSIINIAKAGHFSSDRTITEYAEDIWDIKPIV